MVAFQTFQTFQTFRGFSGRPVADVDIPARRRDFIYASLPGPPRAGLCDNMRPCNTGISSGPHRPDPV